MVLIVSAALDRPYVIDLVSEDDDCLSYTSDDSSSDESFHSALSSPEGISDPNDLETLERRIDASLWITTCRGRRSSIGLECESRVVQEESIIEADIQENEEELSEIKDLSFYDFTAPPFVSSEIVVHISSTTDGNSPTSPASRHTPVSSESDKVTARRRAPVIVSSEVEESTASSPLPVNSYDPFIESPIKSADDSPNIFVKPSSRRRPLVVSLDSDDEEVKENRSSVPGSPSHENKKPLRTPLGQTVVRSKKLRRKDKEAAADALLAEFNLKIFDSSLPVKDIKITWSQSLNKTAGKAHATREWSPAQARYVVRYEVELSNKVLSTEKQIRNTLAHELCHIGVYVKHGLGNDIQPHGPEFKALASRFDRIYHRETVGYEKAIHVSTTHSYEIDYKFRYKCTNPRCGYVYGRHSKSIDILRKGCGYCDSRLELRDRDGNLLQSSSGERFAKDGTPVKLNRFAEFVKSNFAKFQEELKNPRDPEAPLTPRHKDVMALLSKEWKKMKV